MKAIIEAFVEYADAVALVRCWDVVDGSRLLLVPVWPVDAALFVSVAKANGLSARKQAASVYVSGFGKLAAREASRIARALDDVADGRESGLAIASEARRLWRQAQALGIHQEVVAKVRSRRNQ